MTDLSTKEAALAVQEELSGFYYGMDFETYQAIPALNGSALMHMRRSPMKYKWELDHPSESTPAQILGTATHRLILEPERVGEFAVWGEGEDENVRRGKVWDAFKEKHPHQMIVTVPERDAMVGMAVGARLNLPIRKYADMPGKTEVSMFWRDKETGRRMKGRVDKIMHKRDVIFDLKTCVDCHPRIFGAASYRYGYHIKMALYWEGYKTITGEAPKMKMGAIEKKAPFESAVYRVTTDVILQGMEELAELVSRVDECEKTDTWPAEYAEETDLQIPAWALTEQDSLEEFAEPEED